MTIRYKANNNKIIFETSDYDLDKDERRVKYEKYGIIICEKCKEKFNRDWHCRKCFNNETDEEKNRMLHGRCNGCSQVMKIHFWCPSYSGGFAKVYSAIWRGGRIEKWDQESNNWKRSGSFQVALKVLNDSNNLSEDFLNELKFLKKFPTSYYSTYVVECFGITQEPSTLNYALVLKLKEDFMYTKNVRGSYNFKKHTEQYEELKESSHIATIIITKDSPSGTREDVPQIKYKSKLLDFDFPKLPAPINSDSFIIKSDVDSNFLTVPKGHSTCSDCIIENINIMY
ncbi:unnamed protein product [Rhizophagus irregularis]|nr:unnamed protein product [Rhizophagus irregularis]